MSLESWKAEYYPAPADQVAKADALEHSLRKWRGLTAENLARHGVVPRHKFLTAEGDGVDFQIGCDTCALCKTSEDEDGYQLCLEECVLGASRGVPCDGQAAGETLSPYHEWREFHNPEPMISALELAQAWVAKQEAK